MNKQELIERYKTKYAEEPKDWKHPSVNASRQDLFANFIRDLEQLDEPQKPVMPKFAAEYLNYCMANELTLRESLITGKLRLPEYLHKAVDWLNDSMNQNIFAQAWLFGYEVEKEPLYEVVFLEDENDRYLLMELNEHYYEIVPESENDGYRKQYFTEKEIKA
ncbi:DUF1642 domain-containing protein, partial [Enterococcus hirae]|uniref:DUF1642 domain-containing protein n=1 Tax=Enterococcus hirae TaxID=1354 RepID=UPI0013766402